mmetsp:Transcript_364/g.503  ORF Transcript_364/g.503 Transcript_364/m.503 type:complete len:157 (+) Transcript_364:493-963(+)
MSFEKVHSFLRTYWRFTHRQQSGASTTCPAFPTRAFFELRRRVGTASVTLEQFLELFFLFDNKAPDETCVHGARPRVEQATRQLHAQMCATRPFDETTFNAVWTHVARDAALLSCRQLDLLYYMYIAKQMLLHPDDSSDVDQSVDTTVAHTPQEVQ